MLDPARLAQGRSDASSNGHFPMNNMGMNGTPRNFSLGTVPFGNFVPGVPGLPPNGYNPFIGQYPVTVSNWGMPGGDHGGGPMRNGHRMQNARNAGPYDRNGPRRSASGRMSPTRGGARAPRPFMEGGPGPNFISSDASIAGRSIKTYTDLDAAAADKSSTELNY